MRAHYLQHVPFEGLGAIAPWLERAAHEVRATRLFDSEALPGLDAFDLLIVMGGPMSVHDERDHPWLVAEKRFLRAAIEAGKRVLGVCLGAQLIAAALGARVYRNTKKEIGWFPVHGVPSPHASSFAFPSAVDVFHWHGETFDLPGNAVRLARSEACENQAFEIDDRVIGLQFHLEATPRSARDLVEHCREELVASPYIQTEERILSAGPGHYDAIHRLLGELLTHWTRNANR